MTTAEAHTATRLPRYAYDHIPLLEELYERGGRPGEEYALIHITNEYMMQDHAWERIPKSPVFQLIGPKGACQFVLMRDTTKHPIPGMFPEGGRRKCSYDGLLTEETGLEPGQWHKPEVITPVRRSEPKALAPEPVTQRTTFVTKPDNEVRFASPVPPPGPYDAVVRPDDEDED